jgi:hypothetical protein
MAMQKPVTIISTICIQNSSKDQNPLYQADKICIEEEPVQKKVTSIVNSVMSRANTNAFGMYF